MHGVSSSQSPAHGPSPTWPWSHSCDPEGRSVPAPGPTLEPLNPMGFHWCWEHVCSNEVVFRTGQGGGGAGRGVFQNYWARIRGLKLPAPPASLGEERGLRPSSWWIVAVPMRRSLHWNLRNCGVQRASRSVDTAPAPWGGSSRTLPALTLCALSSDSGRYPLASSFSALGNKPANISSLTSIVTETATWESKHSLEDLENQVHYAGAGGPRGVNTPSSEPQTKGVQSFCGQTVVGSTSC